MVADVAAIPRRRRWQVVLLVVVVLLVAVSYLAGFFTAYLAIERPEVKEESGHFQTVAGQEGVVNFSIPYRYAPNVELQLNKPSKTFVSECTSTGFKWKNTGKEETDHMTVTWHAKGMR